MNCFQRCFHPLLLLAWFFLGLGLRLTHLATEAPWTDECATLVFSLGNSFHTVPLDRPISPDLLLAPLQPNPNAGVNQVWQHLMGESTHPPVYFILAHWWMQLFPPDHGLVSLWGARSLSAIFGAAAIPAIFGCCWLAFRSRPIAHLAAAMMAVSPFAIYLAQEARHYTLAILLIIASLSCLLKAAQAIKGQGSFPLWTAIAWIAVNSVGIAVHYFFALTLCSEFIVLMGLGLSQPKRHRFGNSPGRRVFLAILGSLAGSLVWLPVWQGIRHSNLTGWVYDGSPGILQPLLRPIAWLISMVALLPIDTVILPRWVVFLSGGVMAIYIVWVTPLLYRGLKMQMLKPHRPLGIQVLGGVVVAALGLIWGLTYGFQSDLTLAPRFSFIYFPAVMALVGASLAAGLENRGENPSSVFQSWRYWLNGNDRIVIVCWMALMGGLTVIANLGYLQTHRSNLMANLIHQTSDVPVLITTTHRHHGDTGRLMGLAWVFDRQDPKPGWTTPPQFLLAHKTDDPAEFTDPKITLQQAVAGLPRPLDVWAMDFHASIDLEAQHCDRDSKLKVKINDYRYKLYHCSNFNPQHSHQSIKSPPRLLD